MNPHKHKPLGTEPPLRQHWNCNVSLGCSWKDFQCLKMYFPFIFLNQKKKPTSQTKCTASTGTYLENLHDLNYAGSSVPFYILPNISLIQKYTAAGTVCTVKYIFKWLQRHEMDPRFIGIKTYAKPEPWHCRRLGYGDFNIGVMEQVFNKSVYVLRP